jgi:hypothetical protein
MLAPAAGVAAGACTMEAQSCRHTVNDLAHALGSTGVLVPCLQAMSSLVWSTSVTWLSRRASHSPSWAVASLCEWLVQYSRAEL